MRSTGFFNTLLLLPAIISASPVPNVRRDNADNAAQQITSMAITAARQYINSQLGQIDPSSQAFASFNNYINTLDNGDGFVFFNQFADDMSCVFELDFLNAATDVDSVASLVWLSTVITMITESFVNFAGALGLDGDTMQAMQDTAQGANQLTEITVGDASSVINPSFATTLFPISTLETAQLVQLFQPLCQQNDLGILDPLNIALPFIPNPFAASFGETTSLEGFCPNGNAENCFCQTIGPSGTTVSPVNDCAMTSGGGVSFIYVTVGSDALATDPGLRTGQVVSGSVVAGPSTPILIHA